MHLKSGLRYIRIEVGTILRNVTVEKIRRKNKEIYSKKYKYLVEEIEKINLKWHDRLIRIIMRGKQNDYLKLEEGEEDGKG
jgi:hypothetical protein